MSRLRSRTLPNWVEKKTSAKVVPQNTSGTSFKKPNIFIFFRL